MFKLRCERGISQQRTFEKLFLFTKVEDHKKTNIPFRTVRPVTPRYISSKLRRALPLQREKQYLSCSGLKIGLDETLCSGLEICCVYFRKKESLLQPKCFSLFLLVRFVFKEKQQKIFRWIERKLGLKMYIRIFEDS